MWVTQLLLVPYAMVWNMPPPPPPHNGIKFVPGPLFIKLLLREFNFKVVKFTFPGANIILIK